MPVSKEDIKNTYPLPVYNYRVEINSETIAFSEVSGLNQNLETHTYKESPTSDQAGPRVFHMPAQKRQPTLTLKKGIVRGVSVPVLYNWISSIQLNQVEKKDITIRLCDETGAAVISYRLINAFPTQLDAPTFDASSNDVAVESMQLTGDNMFMIDETL